MNNDEPTPTNLIEVLAYFNRQFSKAGKAFSHSAFSGESQMATNKGMAASAEQGTAPKLGSGKCAGPTSASNSRVRCDVTAGETATPFSMTDLLQKASHGLETSVPEFKWIEEEENE